MLFRRLRHAAVIVNDARIAPLPLDDRPQPLESGTGIQRASAPLLRVSLVPRNAGCDKHALAQFEGVLDQIRTAIPLQQLDALDNLVSIADGAADRPVHRG